MIFSIAIGADYSYEVKNSEIYAPAFFKRNNSFIATVVQCSGVKVCIEYYKICLKVGPTVFYKHSVASEMAATQNEDPHFNF